MDTSPTPALTLNEVVALNVRLVLAEHQMSQSKLAASLNRTRPWLSDRMAGRTKYRTDEIEDVAAALDVEVERLLIRPGK